jgi:hypothetical protein
MRVGVLGAGWAGESHVAAYSRLSAVEVTGLWNRTKTRAEALAGKLGYPILTVYEGWRSLISTGNCDVISIATAPMLRSDPLLAALDQGCHVFPGETYKRRGTGGPHHGRCGGGGQHRHSMLFQPAICAGLSDSSQGHPAAVKCDPRHPGPVIGCVADT